MEKKDKLVIQAYSIILAFLLISAGFLFFVQEPEEIVESSKNPIDILEKEVIEIKVNLEPNPGINRPGYTITRKPTKKYDVKLEDNENIIATIEDVDESNPTINFKVGFLNNGKSGNKIITTEVFAAENLENFTEAEITLVKEGLVETVFRCKDFDYGGFDCDNWEEVDISFTDNGDYITFSVDSFSGYAGGYIEVLNVQSYPEVGGRWTVEFNTIGTANLTITAVNGTTWSDEGHNHDLKFLEVKCKDKIKKYDWIDGSVFIEDYNCDETAYEMNKVLTPGKHHLKFEFGNSTAYAHNDAGGDLSCTVTTSCSYTDVMHLSNTSNAHGELNNNSDYSYKVCCNETTGATLTTTCGTELLHLSNQTNAHAENSSESDYDYNVCLDSPTGNITCSYESSCAAWDTCVVSLSNYTNAHLGDCTTDPYTTLLCCNFTSTANQPPTHTQPILNSTSGTNTTDENLTVYNQSTADADGDAVKNIIDWKLEGTSIAILNMPMEANLIAESGTKVRDYALGNNGTVDGATWGNDIGYDSKGAYSFDGTDDFINLTEHVATLDNYANGTISLWFNSTTAATAEDIFWIGDKDNLNNRFAVSTCCGNCDSFYADESLKLLHQKAGGAIELLAYVRLGHTYYCDNQWHHVAFRVGGPNNAIFVDGVEQSLTYRYGTSTTFNSFLNVNSADSAGIGRRFLSGYGSQYFSGIIDDVLITNSALSAAQIKALNNSRTDLIVSQETSVGDNWSACITPNDGADDGNTNCSNTLTILANQPPTQGIPILNSSLGTNFTTENLTVYNQSTSDPDGDPVKNIINWYVNSSSITVLNMPMEGGAIAEGDTKVKDYSGQGNNGTVSGATYSSTGGYDGKGAYSFDGSDCIQLAQDVFSTPTAISVEGRFKSGSTTNLMLIFSIEGYYAMYLNPIIDGKLLPFFDGSSGSDEVGSGYNDDQWHHFVAMNNGTYTTLYVDGAFVDTRAESLASIDGVSRESAIGSQYTCSGNQFSGSVDDIRIYFNRTLSPEEILALNNSRTDLIVSNETSVGDIWQACITPNDGTQDGTEKCSNNLTIITDTTPPTVSVTSFPSYVSGTISVNASVTDAGDGLKDNSCEKAIYSGAASWSSASDDFVDEDASGLCYDNWDTTLSTSGTNYTINFRVNDTADNRGNDSTPSYTVVCNDLDPALCQQACTDAAYTWLSNGTGTNSDCCGDDGSADDFVPSSGSCCYDGSVLTDNTTSSSVLCFNGALLDCGNQVSMTDNVDTDVSNCEIHANKYCDASSYAWISLDLIPNDCTACIGGDECVSGLCIEGTCRASCDSYTTGVNKCSFESATDYATFGMCTYNTTAATSSCDTGEAAFDTSNYLISCLDSAADYGDECDADSLSGGFQTGASDDGVCGDDSGTHNRCWTDYASDPTSAITVSTVFGGSGFVCGFDISFNGYYCDDISDGSFSPGTQRCDYNDTVCDPCSSAPLGADGDCEYVCGADLLADENSTDTCIGSSAYINGNCGYITDGDASQDACICMAGSNLWNLGGETSASTCCDDGSENNETRVAGASMDNGYVTNPSDDACCLAATDCVDTSTCYDTTYASTDIDSDGDNDYCNAGTWVDCNTDSECGVRYSCSSNECVFNYAPTQSNPWIGAHNIITKNLIAEWRFENNAVDELGVKNATAYNGNVAQTDEGRVGKAYTFDGNGDTISIGNLVGGETKLTAAVWVNPAQLPSGATEWFFGEGANFRIGIESDGDIQCWHRDTGGADATTTTATPLSVIDKWYHVVCVFDGDALDRKIYVDGELEIDGSTAVNPLQTGTNDFTIGDAYSGSGNYFNGTLDEILIWEDVLTTAEISELYNATAGLYKEVYSTYDLGASANNTDDTEADSIKNIVNWYQDGTSITILNMPFESGSNSSYTKDYSSYGNNGTVVNVTWNATGGYDNKGAYEFVKSAAATPATGYIEINDTLFRNLSEFTLETWVYPYNLSQVWSPIVMHRVEANQNRSFSLELNYDNLKFFLSNDCTDNVSEVSQDGITINQWHHLVGTFDGTTMKLYRNGNLVNTSSFTGPGCDKSARLLIGAYPGTSYGGTEEEEFDGMIDEVTIFNRSLSAEQIQALYENQTLTIMSEETVDTDVWKACLTPNDGVGDGNESCTANITLNHKPTQGTPILNSSTGINTTDENLTVYNQSTSDTEGGAVVNKVTWYRNSRSYPGTPHDVGYDDLVLKMPFDNYTISTDTYKDYSGYSNDGTVSGATWNATGGYDGYGAYDYNAGNNRITLSGTNFAEITAGNLTLSMWVKTTDGNHQALFSQLDGGGTGRTWLTISTSTCSNKEIAAALGGTILCSTTPTILETWYHITLTYDGTDLKLYIDGEEEASDARSIDEDADGDFLLGVNKALTSDLTGSIDEVLIFDRSLTADEVRGLYQRKADTILSSELEADDIWQACITPYDGNQDGVESCSNNLTVVLGNVAPTHSTPILNSSSGTNTTDENLTVYNQSTSDVNGDPVVNKIKWYKNQRSYPQTPAGINHSNTALKLPFENYTQSSDTYKDYSSHGNNVTVIGATWNATGGNDNYGAYEFDGVFNYMYISDDASLDFPNTDSEFTITAWINSETLTGNQSIVGKYNSFNSQIAYYFHTNGDELTMWLSEDGTDSAIRKETTTDANMAADTWYHVAVTSSISGTDNIDFYVNGVLKTDTVESGTNIISIHDSTETVRLGAVANSSGGALDNFFNGTLDEVQIYNRSLSSDEILSVYEGREADKIYSNETEIDDIWQACITPYDGTIDGNESCSNNLTILAGDTAAPKWQDNQTNHTTKYGDSVWFSVNWTDDTGVDTSIFSWNGTSCGAMQNVSTADAGGALSYVHNTTQTVSCTNGQKVCYKFYANDTNNYWNETDTWCFTVENAVPTQDNPWIGAHTNEQSGKVGEWRFEVDAIDETGVNNGTISGANQTDEGRVGKAYEFDGSDDYITVSHSTSLNLGAVGTKYSASAWFKYNSGYVMLDKGTNLADYPLSCYVASNKIDCYTKDGSNNPVARSTTTVNDDKWHFFVFVVDKVDNESKLYVDGSLEATASHIYNGSFANTGNFKMGENAAGGFDFNGSIDEVTIWNRSLNASEISDLYNTSAGDYAYIDQDIGASANNTEDADNHDIKNIINWYKDGTSITVLNMPFEANLTAELGTKVRNYAPGNNGTVYGATWVADAGYDGRGAFNFDGDYIRVGSESWENITGYNYSYALWIKPANRTPTSTDYGMAFDLHTSTANSRGSGVMYWFTGGNQQKVGPCIVSNSTTNFGGNYYSAPFNEWTFVGCILEKTGSGYTVKEIINGDVVATRNLVGQTDLRPSLPATIGVIGNLNSNFYFNGTIDELMVFNISLTAAQIQALYENQSQTIVSEETVKDEKWMACITPNDGYADGTEICTENITIMGACVDNDGDGYGTTESSLQLCPNKCVYDCDDTNASIYPGASDTPGNAIDEDCDGSDDTYNATPDFKDQSITETYYVGDYVRYRVLSRNSGGTLEDPSNITIQLLDYNGTVLKTQYIEDMIKEGTGNHTGEFASYDLSHQDYGVCLNVSIHNSSGQIEDIGFHPEENLINGTAPIINAGSFTWNATNALSNYTVEGFYVRDDDWRYVNWTTSRLDFHSRPVNLTKAMHLSHALVSVNLTSWPELNISRFVPFNASISLDLYSCDLWAIYHGDDFHTTMIDAINDPTIVEVGTPANDPDCNITLSGDSQYYCSNPVCVGNLNGIITYNVIHFSAGDGFNVINSWYGENELPDPQSYPEFSVTGVIFMFLILVPGVIFIIKKHHILDGKKKGKKKSTKKKVKRKK
ncbi:MAG: LamG-like jellyroll fold domain-containing protein [Candidatus Woesearchaeota archaeon]